MKPKYAYSVCSALGGVFFLITVLLALISQGNTFFLLSGKMSSGQLGIYFVTSMLPVLIQNLLCLLLAVAMLANWRSPVATTGFALVGLTQLLYFFGSIVTLIHGAAEIPILLQMVRYFLSAAQMLLVTIMGFACLTPKVTGFRLAMRKLWFLPAVFAFLAAVAGIVFTYASAAPYVRSGLFLALLFQLLPGLLLTAAWAMAGRWFASLPVAQPRGQAPFYPASAVNPSMDPGVISQDGFDFTDN